MSATMYRPGGATNGKPGGGTRIPIITPEDYMRVCLQRDEAVGKAHNADHRLKLAMKREDDAAKRLNDEIDSHNQTAVMAYGVRRGFWAMAVLAAFFAACWTVQYIQCQAHWDELPKAEGK